MHGIGCFNNYVFLNDLDKAVREALRKSENAEALRVTKQNRPRRKKVHFKTARCRQSEVYTRYNTVVRKYDDE